MINSVVLIGRLTKDIELKYTVSGIAVATFILAVNRQFTNAQGEREADFIQCVLWRKAAENFAKFTHKGSLVGINGRFQTRNYENNQGNRIYVSEVMVENFSLLEPKNSSANNQLANQQNNVANSTDSTSNQFRNPYRDESEQANKSASKSDTGNLFEKQDDPWAAGSEPIDISDDDLPF
ncbi:single-stranded DNA-binding protein [Lapidilactobacillus wuchangensis]|uniref:single-stranded DNA-binding protein n=1 Tax=Lapidilactobacillus wuchangensis TaxID=2486001 RepID=UPI000F79CE1C|nr:single-stranded DNA-binding protein [Lapidilactobacillus wuchangensis]